MLDIKNPADKDVIIELKNKLNINDFNLDPLSRNRSYETDGYGNIIKIKILAKKQ